MTKTSSGVYQLPNGTWGFRYAFWVDGKQKDIKRTKDENGKPFKTERAATKAREAAIIEVHTERTQKPAKKRMTVAEVFKEYCETGRHGKAYGTTRKQDSLWKNHLSKKFGKRYVDDRIMTDAKMAIFLKPFIFSPFLSGSFLFASRCFIVYVKRKIYVSCRGFHLGAYQGMELLLVECMLGRKLSSLHV